MMQVGANTLSSLDSATVAELAKMQELLTQARDDIEFLKDNLSFQLGKPELRYEISKKKHPVLDTDGVGTVTINGMWKFTEDLPPHVDDDSVEKSRTRTYRLEITEASVFDLYRTNYLIETEKQDFRPVAIAWMQKKYKLFKDFVKRSGTCEID